MIMADLVFEPTGLRGQPAEVICQEMASFFGHADARNGLAGDLAAGFVFQLGSRPFRCHIAHVREDGTPVVHIGPIRSESPIELAASRGR